MAARTAVLGPASSTLVWVGVACVTVFFTCLVFVVFLVSLPFDRKGAWSHRVTAEWGRSIVRLMPRWGIRVTGVEHLRHGPFVIVANHQSLVDILVTFFLPLHFKWLSKRSVFNTPFMGWMMWMSRYIPLVRNDRSSTEQSMAKSADWIRRGVSVMFFPEGTRSRNGQIGRFKLGAFKLAMETKAPILPIVILGTRACLPRDSLRLGSKGVLRLVVGPPIPSPGVASTDPGPFAERVRERLVAMKEGAESSPVS